MKEQYGPRPADCSTAILYRHGNAPASETAQARDSRPSGLARIPAVCTHCPSPTPSTMPAAFVSFPRGGAFPTLQGHRRKFGKEACEMTKQTSAGGTSLDSDLETFRDELRKASELVVRLYGGLDRARVTPAKSRMEIASLFDEPFPEEPQPMEAILREVENNIFANSTLYLTPRFFGYINAGGNQAAVLGELLASAVNQIGAKWHFSPAASEVERRVIRWIAQFIGYSPEAGGCLLSGGSTGNLVGLAVARKQKAQFDAASLGMRGGPPVTVYVSQEGHASLEKSMVLLGMGRNQLRKIAVLDDFTIDLEALEKQVTEDRKNGYRGGKCRHDQYRGRGPAGCAGGVLPEAGVVVPRGRGLRRTCGRDRNRRATLPGIGPSRLGR